MVGARGHDASRRVALFGATGATGQQLLREALGAGFHVTAVVRRPEAVGLTDSRLRVIEGDVLTPAWLELGIDGSHAVISALGARPMRPPTTIYSEGTAAIVAAMRAVGTTRLLVISASPLGPTALKSRLERRVIEPLLYRFLGGGYDDMGRMEQLLADSPLDWTVFRPPRLTNRSRPGKFRTAVDTRLPRASSISRATLAAAMLAAVDDPALYRKAVAIAK